MEHSTRALVRLTALLAPLCLAAACASPLESATPGAVEQTSFDTPDAAARTFFNALEADDRATVTAVLGADFVEAFVAPDWDARQAANREIARAAAERLVVEDSESGGKRLALGEEGWLFPIELEQDDDGRWRFDVVAGLEEIIDRRIGRNELAAIAIAQAYADAQIEYAREDRDGDDVLEYAQKLISSPGQRDGLYWPAEDGEAPSPFGSLVDAIESEVELGEERGVAGYQFRVLTRQGSNPQGGGYDYVVDGNMIAGFALVAFPQHSGGSGVMSFVVNHRGVVYEKDRAGLSALEEYDPNDSWNVVGGSSPASSSASGNGPAKTPSVSSPR